MRAWQAALVALAAWLAFSWVPHASWYQLTTSVQALRDLYALSPEDVDRCTEAYRFLENGTATSDTDRETAHVRSYYKVASIFLSLADIEKMYIPPQLDARQGLFGNQHLVEREVTASLRVGPNSTVLDVGCGRGRIAHHVARLTGGQVAGFNIDETQIASASAYAAETGFADRLAFTVADHHKPFPYPDARFDGGYSFQAIWPFFKAHELDHAASELFRVLKPGAIYACSEYLLTPHFDRDDPHHQELHALFLPTLAATQSNYPADVTAALARAGFTVLLSAPSRAPAWPLTDQKTDLFLALRAVLVGLSKVGLVPVWAEAIVSNLLKGGVAWAEAEKAKIADLNWRIVVQKPPQVLAL